MVSELVVAFGLILVIEGVLYSLFPGAMKRLLEHVRDLPVQSLRTVGLISTVLGVLIVWLTRR